MRKTKIVCTLGPATEDEKILEDLMKNGMDVARCNFSHGTHDDHKKRMDKIKKSVKNVTSRLPFYWIQRDRKSEPGILKAAR